MHEIEELIKTHLNISNINSNGWCRVVCKICSDHGNKGPRGGWLFTDDVIFYHCFNCSVDLNFSLTREHPFSKGMYEGFLAFGIPIDQINKIINLKKKDKKEHKKSKSKLVTPIPIPNHFYKLKDSNTDLAEYAKEYLKEEKCIDPNNYEFYLSTGISDNKNNEKEILYVKALKNRIIIPAFYKNQMIYYIARSLLDNPANKYLNAQVPKTGIVYGMDNVFLHTDAPLFITEGFFDSFHVNGIAVLENKISSSQLELIQKCTREKIVIPDKKNDFNALAEKAIELGWGVSFPEIGNCKDITEGIKKYGKLYVLASIMKNIKYGNSASIELKNY